LIGERNGDVVVVGGGIIGLSIAWRLAQRGESVTLIDKGRVGREASYAAAGMLAPFAEAATRGPFSDLGVDSLSRYAAFVEELKSETSIDAELVRTGLLRVARKDEEADLRATYAAIREMGSAGAEWIEASALHKIEPALADSVTAAIYSPTEWQVDPRRLLSALAVAAANRGVRVVEHAPVTGFTTTASVVTGVATCAGRIEAHRVVLAGGSWNAVLGSWLGAAFPVRPVRGQLAALGPCFDKPLRHTIYSYHGYLVPRTGGRVLVGSTEDDAGFDSRPTAGGIAEILAQGVALAPELATAPVEDLWAGLRPFCSVDRMPILGRIPGWDNAFVAGGHFRNGILLAPATAYKMDALVSGADANIDAAFSPARFAD
jgi:glycine oxidase